MEVIRYPDCDAYHFHHCHMAESIVSRKEEMRYDIGLADTFWEPCKYCIHDRAKTNIVDNPGVVTDN